MTSPDPRTKRPEFLIEVYKQMMADINRHIVVVWQSVGVVVTSFAILGLVEKKVLTLDIAASLLVLICAWAIGLLIDSNYWYNRNLCIIANIERLFLFEADLKDVHYYFGAHRPDNRMMTTLRIQLFLCLGIGALVVSYHFLIQVLPGFGAPFSDFDLPRALPYAFTVISGWILRKLNLKRKKDYKEFLRNSPGISIATAGIHYGGGHGFHNEGG